MDELTSEEASAIAVHKTRNAQQAIESAREIQILKAVEATSRRTKADVLEVFKEVFGESDTKDPEQMRIIMRRVPLLCLNVEMMHTDISEIKDNQKWATRAAVGALVTIFIGVVAALVALAFRFVA
jgi:hypothetical protein